MKKLAYWLQYGAKVLSQARNSASQIFPIAFHLGDPSTEWLFMDDNPPPHLSLLVKEFKQTAGLRSFQWLPASPDLNSVENVWSFLKKCIRRLLKPSDGFVVDLESLFRREWDELSQIKIDRMIQSMPNRIRSVIEKSGPNTKYWKSEIINF